MHLLDLSLVSKIQSANPEVGIITVTRTSLWHCFQQLIGVLWFRLELHQSDKGTVWACRDYRHAEVSCLFRFPSGSV
jgi:hypothetical protein